MNIIPRQKTEWQSIGIPKTVFQKIKRVIIFTGHPSVSEYVREKVNHALTLDLINLEKFEEWEKEKEEII